MSEKRDLWVPVVLALAGIGLMVWHTTSGSIGLGLVALVLGLVSAVVCLPLRLKRGQARLVGFGVGVGLLLASLVPGATTGVSVALAWILTALAFLAPMKRLPQGVRGAMLIGAAIFAVLGLLAAVDQAPRSLLWLFLAAAFFLAAQVWSSRPQKVPEVPPGPRVCVMGGSFDPFHRGHRALAQAALRVVDRLLVVPAGQAPHKRGGKEVTAFHHRVAMARLGLEGLARTEVLELEGRRAGPSYTVDTLDVLRTGHPPGTRFLLLVGADMYQDLPNWREWERILDSVTLLVAARPGYDLEPPPEFERRNVAAERLQAPEIELSSTELRRDIAARRPVGERISPAVQAYVRDHALYLDTPSEG